VAGVIAAELLGDQDVERLPDELFARVAEQRLGLG
jgi:hypothetical protein